MNKKVIGLMCVIIVLLLSTLGTSTIVNNIKGVKEDTLRGSVPETKQGLIVYADELIKDSKQTADMAHNTKYLQGLVDKVSDLNKDGKADGGIIYLPAGTYYFTKGGTNNSTKPAEYVIKCKNNVTIIGAGNSDNGTILKPYGTPMYGLDMFYFNDYGDNQQWTTPEEPDTFLENADFKNFVIDSSETKGDEYTTAGKGFMINLFKNCDWENITVKNTDGTGFGVDCPINSTIINCTAINCGKNANETMNEGASGFGIGTGYSEDEYMLISNCTSIGNYKYGFFFEHQGRWWNNFEAYPAKKADGFVVADCVAYNNMYDFGGLQAHDVTYINCISKFTDSEKNKSQFNFGMNSVRCNVVIGQDENGRPNYVENKFVDIDESMYYYDAVRWATSKGLTNGATKTNFVLEDGNTTRLQAILYLYRYLGMPGNIEFGDQDSGYQDVNTNYGGNWKAVKWAKDNSIMKNIVDENATNLSYDTKITRGQFIQMLWNTVGNPEPTTEANYADKNDAKYQKYKKAIDWANEIGIVTGHATTSMFSAGDDVLRVDVMTFLQRFDKNPREYGITYNLQGGSLSKPNLVTYKSGIDIITLNNPTKEGYIFEGWVENNINIPTKEFVITTETVGQKVYTAVWEPIKYKISFDSNGGTGEMEDENFVYDVPQVLMPNEFSKEGYDFAGWNTKVDGTGITYSNVDTIFNLTKTSNEDITLYAQWTNSNAENRKNIFIGASGFVEMRNIIGENGDIYSAERGQGIDWLKKTGLATVEDKIGENTNIIIGVGSNDLFYLPFINGQVDEVDVDAVVEKYARYLNAKIMEWTKAGANVYFNSVGPFDESKIDIETRKINNADTVDFNNKIQLELKGETFIDTYTPMLKYIDEKNPDIFREDGSHGTALYYSIKYDLTKEKLGQEYIPTFESFDKMTDISENADYIEALKWVYANVYMNPKTETEFAPNDVCTRADAISLIWRSQGIPYVTNSITHTDVSENALYYDAIRWAVAKGISEGSSVTAFEPNKNVTRGQYIAYLYNFAGKPQVTTGNNYADVQDGMYYTMPINWAVKLGITEDESTFRPDEDLTRAEAITFLYNFYNADTDVEEDVKYTVEHYKQNIDGTYPQVPAETQEYDGTVGDEITAELKTYEGFTSPEAQTKTLVSGENVIRYEYARKSFNVTITKGNGIEEVTGAGSYKYEEPVELSATVKEGYSTVTWVGDYTINTFNMPAKEVEITVNVEAIKYTIQHNLDGGTVQGNPSEYTIETEDITLNNPTKAGHTFLGWTGSNGTTPQKEVVIAKGTKGNLNYTANWKVEEIEQPDELVLEISYSPEGPTNGDVKVTISANNKIKPLIGWTLSNDGKSMYKTYSSNTQENITIVDEYDNEENQQVVVNNIDKQGPKVEVTKELKDNKVIVTITADEKLQKVDGWDLSEDRKSMTKTYDSNLEEDVVISDFAGNEVTKTIKVYEIKENNDEENTNHGNQSDKDKGENNTAGGNKVDTTISQKQELPKAGVSNIIKLGIAIIIVAGIVFYSKLRKYRDIK